MTKVKIAKQPVTANCPVTLNPNGVKPAKFKTQIKKNTVNKYPVNLL